MSSFTEFAHMLTNTISDNINKFQTKNVLVHSDSCAKNRCSFNNMHVKCNCNTNKDLIRQLKLIENKPHKLRLSAYRQFLLMHKDLFGLIVSQPTFKCVGMINLKGEIKHFNAVHAISPYSIIVNKGVKDILSESKLKTENGTPSHSECQNQSENAKGKNLGICVNSKGAKIATLTRVQNRNYIMPFSNSHLDKKIPVLAIVVKADLKPDVKNQKVLKNKNRINPIKTEKVLDKLVHQSMY